MRISSFLFVAIAIVIYVICAPATSCDPFGNPSLSVGRVGEKTPIQNINDPYIQIQELGAWAVLAYNSKVNCGLKFNKVVSGEEAVAAGMFYILIIDADVGGKDGKFKAEVLDQPWIKRQPHKLISFSEAH